jgi:hypothetical protein
LSSCIFIPLRECFKKEQGIKEPADKAEKNNDS